MRKIQPRWHRKQQQLHLVSQITDTTAKVWSENLFNSNRDPTNHEEYQTSLHE